VPPVVYTEEGTKAVGLLPPALGLYAEFTDFFHLGALFKATADLEWDRRGYGTIVDVRTKVGLGPVHYVDIKQTPIWYNAYKVEGSEMDGWRQHMAELRDPVFHAPAKTMIFKPDEEYGAGAYQNQGHGLRYLYKGWNDWETISLEVAVPLPFICHLGVYFRAGCDPSQLFDFVLSLACLDLYDDAAYETFSGKPKY
jgi:hypothetical protein